MNKTFTDRPPRSQVGYSGFPLDHLVNFTSACGYLIPIFHQLLDPGDKVTIKNFLHTRTQPLTTPAMATVIERVEWFAVPIEQLDKAFSPKYFGINDVESDLLPTTFNSDQLPCIPEQHLNAWLYGKPRQMVGQGGQTSSEPSFTEAKRLLDALGCPKALGNAQTVDIEWQHSLLAYFPAAYQKIYYDHYRLTDRVPNDPEAYNLDSFHNNPIIQGSTQNSRLDKLLMLHKRPYNLDYFTSMDVSPLFGSTGVNASGVDLGKVQQWLSGLSNLGTASPSTTANYPDGGTVSPNNSDPTSVRVNFSGSGSASLGNISAAISALNPANIRSLFAVEKLLEVTRKAKKHYDKQVLAHFGVEVPKGRSGECLKIGTHEQYLQIGDVISSATTQTPDGDTLGALGELAGRGQSKASSSEFHFEAKTHCVLMGIYSAEPLMSYENNGMMRINTMTRASDWYKSEFDRLGQQPVFQYELYDYPYNNAQGDSSNAIIGWQDRYSQLKAAYNRSFAGAATTFFREWFLNRKIYPNVLTRYFFEIWPTDMNDILQKDYTGTVADGANQAEVVYSNDYLVNQLYCDVVKVSKKSLHGTPNM